MSVGTRTRWTAKAAAVLATAVIAVMIFTEAGSGDDRGGLTLFVSPSRIELELRDPAPGTNGRASRGSSGSGRSAEAIIGLTCLANPVRDSLGWLRGVDVQLYTGLGGHDLDGTPILDDSLEARASAGRLVDISPRHLTLRAGETRQVRARFHQPEGRSGGLYPVIFVEWVPAKPPATAAPPAAEGSVSNVSRLGVLCLISVPGQGFFKPVVERVGVLPGAPPRVEWIIANRGTCHGCMVGRVTVRKYLDPCSPTAQRGDRPSQMPCATGTILPGRARAIRIPIDLGAVKGPGAVAALALWRAGAKPAGGTETMAPGKPELTSSVRLEVGADGSLCDLSEER